MSTFGVMQLPVLSGGVQGESLPREGTLARAPTPPRLPRAPMPGEQPPILRARAQETSEREPSRPASATPHAIERPAPTRSRPRLPPRRTRGLAGAVLQDRRLREDAGATGPRSRSLRRAPV